MCRLTTLAVDRASVYFTGGRAPSPAHAPGTNVPDDAFLARVPKTGGALDRIWRTGEGFGLGISPADGVVYLMTYAYETRDGRLWSVSRQDNSFTLVGSW